MKKLILLIILFFPIYVNALELPELYSTNFLIHDLTDDVTLHQLKADEKRNVASLTKIVTTITAIENIEDLDQKVVVTNEMLYGIPWDASVAGLKAGDELTVRDVLYASILPSGADATHVLAYTSFGSIKKFVEAMNNLAKKAGANDTNFVNVTGYDENNHYSTANDVLKILKYALQNETFKDIYCTKKYTMSNGKDVYATIHAYKSKLGLDISRVKGSKTGFTDNAGTCISILTSSNGHDYIIITLNAPYEKDQAYNMLDALSLINFLDNNYNEQKLLEIGQEVKTINVRLSNIDTYTITGPRDITKYLPNDYDKNKVKIEYEGKEVISFNDNIYDALGTIKVYYDDALVGETVVELNEDIKVDFMKILNEYRIYFIGLGGLLLLLIFLIILLKKRTKRRSK